MTAAEEQNLASCRLFHGIGPEDRRALCACLGGRRGEFRRGERVWLTGDPVSGCGVVLRGGVRAETVSESGRRTVTAVHGPGSVFGDVLMATPGGRSPVDLFASEEGTAVLFLPYLGIMDGCAQCCTRHARLRENLLAEISEKFWELRRKIGYLSVRSLRGRIALRLLDERARTGQATFSLGCGREDLADLLGVNRSALSRELSRMREDGLIDCYRDSFRILDPAGLEACLD